MCTNGHPDSDRRTSDNRCMGCRREADRARRKRNKGTQRGIKQAALDRAKSRAKKQNVPCTLTMANMPDVPDFCPILGIPIICGGAGFDDNSPSLDKIIPEFGYTPENVQWISNRANIVKSNATPTELIKVGLFFGKKVEEVFEARGMSLPSKDFDWWASYWTWYEGLDSPQDVTL